MPKVDLPNPPQDPVWYVISVGKRPVLRVQRRFWYDVREVARLVLNRQRRATGGEELSDLEMEFALQEEVELSRAELEAIPAVPADKDDIWPQHPVQDTIPAPAPTISPRSQEGLDRANAKRKLNGKRNGR